MLKMMLKRITAIGLSFFIMLSLTEAVVPIFVGAAEKNSIDNDMEVKTYLKEISVAPANKFVDEGNRTKISGWDLNQIGGEVTGSLSLSDKSPVLPVEAKREFENITYGKAELYYELTIGNGVKDAVVSLRNGNSPSILYGVDSENIWIQTPSGKRNLLRYKQNVPYLIYTAINMDNKSFDVYIDNKEYAKGIGFNADVIDNFFFSSGNSTVGDISISRNSFSLKRGYWIDESFGRGNGSILPPNWSLKKQTGQTTSDAPVQYDGKRGIKIGGVTEPMTLSKTFGKQTRDFTAEFYMRIMEGCTNASVKFTGGGNTVFEISADENSLYYKDASGKPVKFYNSYKKDLWYIFWAEINLSSHTFDLYLEDKKVVSDIPLSNDVSYVDTFEASGTNKNSPFYLSKIEVYPTERFDDYVPEPNVVRSDGVDIGMQYFGLWNEGGHFGWEVVDSSDFRRPLDGLYDEDSIEHWDWQIKYWVEHGIDYVAPCWYAPDTRAYESEFVRHPFFKAKYSDKMKFALLMEVVGWNTWEDQENGMETWLKNCGRQMIEYYFKDSRYYTNGGRPVVFLFGCEYFKSSFGTYANQVMERLGDMCEAEGIGRPLYIFHFDQGFDTWDSGSLEIAKELNADGFYHYSLGGWFNDAMSANNRHIDIAAKNNLAYVPTISNGFDDYSWNINVGHRWDKDLIKKAVELYKDEMLPKLNGLTTPMLNLATWNEWGEGHYWGPSEGYGFSMLDAVRDVLTDGGNHTDITPDAHQKDRFNNLYPSWRKARLREINVGETPSSEAYEKYVWNFDNSGAIGWETKNTVPAKVENGIWKLTADDSVIINLTDSDIDTSGVTHIKIRLKNKGGGYGVSTKLKTPFWDTAVTRRTMYTELKTQYMKDSDEFVDFYIPVGEYPEFWRGVLDSLTIIFEGFTPEETMDIDSISFMAESKGEEVTVSIDGWSSNDTSVKIKNGFPMLPLREIMYKLKGQVYYEEKTGNVILQNLNGDVLTEFTPGGEKVICNDKEYTLPNSSMLDGGTTWVDAQIISLACQKHASWDANEKNLSLVDSSTAFEIERPNTDRELLWSYEFDDVTGLNGWGGMDGFAVSDGVAEFITSNTDPQVSIKLPSVDTTKAMLISIGLKSTAAFDLQIFFDTASSPGLSEGKSFKQYVTASDSIQEYVIATDAHPAFKGNVTSLRIDTGSQIGVSCGIDYIRIYGDFERELTEEELIERINCREETKEGIVWNFNANTNRDGWNLSRSLANAVMNNGVMNMDIICKTPFIETAETSLSADAATYDKVKFSLTNNTESKKAKVYFTTVQDPAWSEDKSVDVDILNHCGINMVYTADFSSNVAWNGKIRALRIAIEDMEERENRGEIGIDYVKLLRK